MIDPGTSDVAPGMVKRFGPTLRWLGHVLVFFAIPLLIVAAGIGRTWDREERMALERAFTRIDQQILLMRKRGDTRVYLGEQFQALRRVLKNAPPEEFSKTASKAMHALSARFPGLLRLVIVDRNGRRIAPELTPSVGPAIAARLFEVFGEGNRRAAAKKHKAVLKGYLGPAVNLEERLDDHQAKLIDADPTGKWRWLVHCGGDWGIFCAHIRHTAAWNQLAYRDQTRQLRIFRPHRVIDLGIADLRGQDIIPSDVSAGLRVFRRNMQAHHVLPASLVALHQLDAGIFLWGTMARSELPDFQSKRVWLSLFLAGVFGLLATISARFMLGNTEFVLPIRSRLLLLFAFAGGVPMTLIGFVEWDALAELERRRTQEASVAMERQLHALDGQYADLRRDIERQLEALLSPRNRGRLDRQESWRKLMEGVVRQINPFELIVYDKLGQPQIKYQTYGNPQWQEKEIKDERGAKVLGSLIRRMISLLDQTDPGLEDELVLSLAESVAGEEMPIGDLASALGKVFEFSIFREQRWLFLYPLTEDTPRNRTSSSDATVAEWRGAGGKIDRVFAAAWKRDLLERFFLVRSIPSFERRFPGIRVMGWSPNQPSNPIPQKSPLYKPLRPFLARLEILGGSQFGELQNRNGNRLLVAGIKPRLLSDHLLVAVRDDRFIHAERQQLIRNLVAFSATLFAIILFLGFILSKRLLQPIGELTGGIEAIARRDFSHRLPEADPDELGRLSQAFNQMMEGLSDLAVGRIVQEHLFPKEQLTIGPYRVFGRSHPASELGGDYFEIKQLSDDRALIIIGDVSGHGVGAAMVMAMAKIMVEHCLPDFQLARFTTTFNDSLFRVMKRKRMMSSLLAILDTRRHVLELINAGHNFPYVIRNHAKLLEHIGNSYPLGSRAKLSPTVVEIPINPGDTLLFYTDGLIETDTGSDQLGYEKVATALPGLVVEDLEQSCTAIYAWNRRQAVRPQQDDDITLLLIKRE
ncbi:MAG TPA: SpoIIE family protein phosphatase [Candidatus Ozemobacteraceae bacterium]|nr:SpoIIE family protein phosphatase [Candidatus Ozemobacteraceae bacterium]